MPHPQFHPQNREEYIAHELAERLGDPQGLPYYLSLARKYPATHLLQILAEVMEVPDAQIRKSRGALFNWLIRRQAEARTAAPTEVPANLPLAPGEDAPPDITTYWPEEPVDD